MLGQAGKVVSTKEHTTIIEGRGDKAQIDERVARIKKEIDSVDSDFDKEKLQERLAKLVGGVGVIKIGAATETEMKEMKLRVEDAINATKAAIEEGIVPGGGVAVLRAAKALDQVEASGDEAVGVDIMRRALEEPVKQIARNAGKDGAVIAEEVKKMDGNKGYNAANDTFEDLVAAGIIDPTKVTRSAVQNAASIASMLLTTEAVVTDLQDEKDDDAGMPSPGMGGGMGMPGMM